MNQTQTKKIRSTWAIYRWPVLINSICLLGVLAALIGNGWWDWLSWACREGTVVGLTVVTTSVLSKPNKQIKAKSPTISSRKQLT
ncbi:MAG: hypothetical protein WCY88_06615 [Spongiibacteraceae bacterium]